MKYELWVVYDCPSSKTGMKRERKEFEADDDTDAWRQADEIAPSMGKGWKVLECALFQGSRHVLNSPCS